MKYISQLIHITVLDLNKKERDLTNGLFLENESTILVLQMHIWKILDHGNYNYV